MSILSRLFRRHILLLIVIGVVAGSLLIGGAEAYSQGLSQWKIPGKPNIQGLDGMNPGDPGHSLYFTEYNLAKIGQISGIGSGSALLAEWSPIGSADGFHPFKIVAGRWDLTSLSSVPPFANAPADVKNEDLARYMSIGSRIWPVTGFTMPDEGAIGLLVGSPFIPSDDYFWLYKPSSLSGLTHPWDIQRRDKSADETSAWVSNREYQTALYQFFPQTGRVGKWDFSNLPDGAITVEVFYVVPGSATKGNTEIWIGGTHTRSKADSPNDCIAYMDVDEKNNSATLTRWDLSGSGSNLRKMNAIRFAEHVKNLANAARPQVWLSSSSAPEITILEPHSIWKSSPVKADSVCINALPGEPNGLYSAAPAADANSSHDDRIWMTSGQTSGSTSSLSANSTEAKTRIEAVRCTVARKSFDMNRQIFRAQRMEQKLFDSSAVRQRRDKAGNIDRVVWDAAGGLTANFQGAMLDIDLQGGATPAEKSTDLTYTIAWHEPTLGRIGILSNTAVASTSSVDSRPAAFNLWQNFPNPFNPITTIEYSLPQQARVTLKVYNTLGQEVRTLVNNEIRAAGQQAVIFDSQNIASGVYFYQLRAERIVSDKKGTTTSGVMMDVKKMIVLK